MKICENSIKNTTLKKRKKYLQNRNCCGIVINGSWFVGQEVKTPPSHGGIRGSIPLRTALFFINSPTQRMLEALVYQVCGIFLFVRRSASKHIKNPRESLRERNAEK